MPWVEKRGKKRVVRWVTVSPKGADITHSSPLMTEPLAEKLVEQLRAKLPDRRRRKPGVRIERPTIARVCELWRAAKVSDRPQSVNYAAEVVRRATAIADEAGILYVHQATAAAIRTLREARPKGTARPLAYLRAVVKWSQDELGLEVDPQFYVASRPPQSKESEARLMTVAEAATMRTKAVELGQQALAHCLSLYGWRPITACRIRCGDLALDDPNEARVRLRIKRKTKPHYHPLFPDSVELLRPLLLDGKGNRRPADERLFLSPTGIPWPIYGDEAKRLVSWYAYHFKGLAPGSGGTNGMKRWALHLMERGLPPWPRPLTLKEIRHFTGHSSDHQVQTYRRVSNPEAQALVDGGSMVEVSKPELTAAAFFAEIRASFAITPDDTVVFPTRLNRT